MTRSEREKVLSQAFERSDLFYETREGYNYHQTVKITFVKQKRLVACKLG